RSSACHSILQPVPDRGEHRALQAVFLAQLVEQPRGRKLRGIYPTSPISRNQQNRDVSRVALGLVEVRIGNDLSDRDQIGLDAGQIAEGNRIVETDEGRIAERRQIVLEENRTVAGGQKDVRRNQRSRTDRKDLAGSR